MDLEILNKYFKKIKLSLEEKTLVITISNPPVNAISTEVRSDIIKVIATLNSDNKLNSEVAEVIFKGEGKFFSAGADIKELRDIVTSKNPRQLGYEFSRKGHALMALIRDLPHPTTAFIDGYATGGGFELALACDKIVATSRSIMGLPEVTLGIIPGWGGTVFFPRKCDKPLLPVCPEDAEEYMETGHLFDANLAEFCGFIDGVVEKTKQSAAPIQTMSTKSASPTARMIRTRCTRNLYQACHHSFHLALEIEATLFGLVCSLPDAKEGTTAFLEKREPKFQKL
jgi:enoyl-CoA hydratase